MIEIDKSLIKQLETLLEAPAPSRKQKEQVIQDFLEQHSEFLPTNNLLNHHLHFEAMISKFPLGTELTTDYIYITKSSDIWRITLVELESPEKKIFTNNTKKSTTTASFNAALDQVRSWKHHLDYHRNEVLQRLEPLLEPLSRNPVEFQYQLIIGRSANKNFTPERKQHIRGLINETEIDILTFDQLISWYENHERYQKLILRLTGRQFAFKYMPFEPTQIFSYVGPDRLVLTSAEIDRLKEAGYEIDKWKEGELLEYNTKHVLPDELKARFSSNQQISEDIPF